MILRALYQNLGWKLFSLAIAVVLWFTFVGSPEMTTSISVPIEYLNMPPGLEMVSGVPERVHLDIQGTRSRLEHVSGVAVVLDLAGVQGSGERTFPIDSPNVQLPYGLKLIRAVPAQHRVEFEARREREISVRPRFSNTRPGYQVRRQEVEPARLRILGPESRVREVEFAETDRIDLSGVAGGAEFRVHAFVRDPQVRFASPPVVRVQVTLEKRP